MRKFSSFYIDDPALFNTNLVSWGKAFPEICILNSNQYRQLYPLPNACHSYDLIAGIGSLNEFKPEPENLMNSLERFTANNGDWLFGHLSYDLKNEIETLSSGHSDKIKFPPVSFFTPQYIFIIVENKLEVGWHANYTNEDQITRLINEIKTYTPDQGKIVTGQIKTVISKEKYLNTVEKIKAHIQRGDIYEVTFCQEYFSAVASIDPPATWLKLIKESPTPFSCYYRCKDKYLLCASPERFIKKTGQRIISQPVKGTSKRGKTPEEDRFLSKSLAGNPKERAENIMITDLVRNDLSKIATRTSVKVDELCGIYPFPHVYQMISTISAELSQGTCFTDIIKATFPMGSMTGAPKIRAMEIIEQYERSKRGLYSGAVGFITPEMDFDFNVVIRSIQYNQTSSYLSFMAGGAITHLSVPESEYHECLLKAKAIMKILDQEDI